MHAWGVHHMIAETHKRGLLSLHFAYSYVCGYVSFIHCCHCTHSSSSSSPATTLWDNVDCSCGATTKREINITTVYCTFMCFCCCFMLARLCMHTSKCICLHVRHDVPAAVSSATILAQRCFCNQRELCAVCLMEHTSASFSIHKHSKHKNTAPTIT
jgi:hypothetical protein